MSYLKKIKIKDILKQIQVYLVLLKTYILRPITIRDIDDIFPIGEAFIDFYYGKIRQGKTYMATVIAWIYLQMGVVVYCSYDIEFNGYDERTIWWKRLLGYIGIKSDFLVIAKENLIKFDYAHMSHEEFYRFFASKTDCVFIIDEAQWQFDSYLGTHMEKEDRMPIFATAHYNRGLILVSQRPMQIHTSLRGNVHRYYKMEQYFKGFWFIPKVFKKTEFQQLRTDGVPDETLELVWDEEKKAFVEGDYKFSEGSKFVFMNMKIANSYNTKYLRGNMKTSQKNYTQVVNISVLRVWQELFSIFKRSKK